MKYTKLFRSNFRNVFHCLKENIKETLLCDLFSLNSCEAARGVCKMKAASAKQRRKFRRETHTPLWLLIGRTLFSLVKKPRSRFGLAVSLFSRVKNIVLWFSRTHLRLKIYDIACQWVHLSTYMIIVIKWEVTYKHYFCKRASGMAPPRVCCILMQANKIAVHNATLYYT